MCWSRHFFANSLPRAPTYYDTPAMLSAVLCTLSRRRRRRRRRRRPYVRAARSRHFLSARKSTRASNDGRRGKVSEGRKEGRRLFYAFTFWPWLRPTDRPTIEEGGTRKGLPPSLSLGGREMKSAPSTLGLSRSLTLPPAAC